MPLKIAALMLLHPRREKFWARASNCFMDQTVRGNLVKVPQDGNKSIGAMRNIGVEAAIKAGADVIVHWDDDDYSFPGRIASQLRDLEESESGVAGYRAMRFWDSTKQECWWYRNDNRRYACGTSLIYQVDIWKRTPFPDLNVGEDAAWCSFVKPVGTLDMFHLVAEIHGGNTCGHIDPEASEWTRMSSQDEKLKEIMKL
jgi:hypothetical protein